MKKFLPLILTVVMAVWFLNTLRPPQEKTFKFSEFGKLPILFNGRLKPMDSLARNSLLEIREKQEANVEPWKGMKAKTISATEWLANVMLNPEAADTWPVFRVDNPELISLMKLPGKDLSQQQDGKHYSWNQIQPSLAKLDEENRRIEKIDSAQRNAYERSVVKMRERLILYLRLKDSLQPDDAQDWPKELAEYESLIPAGIVAVKAQQAGEKYDEAVFKQFAAFVEAFNSMGNFEPPLLIPPRSRGEDKGQWMRAGDALIDAMRDGQVDPRLKTFASMSAALKSGNAPEFNRLVADYRSSLVPTFSRELSKARYEEFYNRMQPFYNAMVIYVLAGLLGFLFWFNLSEPLRRSAVWLIVLAFIIHTTGLVFRMALEGRPPVTNLYSSAIFIGWGAVVLGLILENIYKNGIGAVVAAGIGFITLIIAHHLALTGDTMEMMRAVLDTNFWLATHVVTVTVGYASTFVAGFLALLYIFLGVFTRILSMRSGKRELTTLAAGAAVGGAVGAAVAGSFMKSSPAKSNEESVGKSIARMIYGIVCFATLFSFVGTVLGGIWADQSWGRFWGWDPKENGALIIVLWNALILHLRWGGMIRERGMAICGIVGNIVTSWSWFGVNMLGIGLHSYGFMDSAFWWLLGFVFSQLALIVVGSLPLSMWKSFRDRLSSAAPANTPEPART